MLQARKQKPRMGMRDPLYTPERDVAHVGPWLIERAMRGLDERPYEPWFEKYLEDQHVSWEDILEGVRRMGLALTQVIQQTDIRQALEEAKFFELPPPVVGLLFMRLGQTFLGAVWVGVKDISDPESLAPLGLSQIVDMAEEVRSDLQKAASHEQGSVALAQESGGTDAPPPVAG
jgi:hypothetical protein